MNKVLFQAPQSAFDPTFWEKLYDLKLNVLKLDSSDFIIRAAVSCSDGNYSQPIEFSRDSYDKLNKNAFSFGTFVNVNTVEEFRDFDKKMALKQAGVGVLSSILSLAALRDPSELTSFVLLAFADLKAYRFTYWLGVPAVLPDAAFVSLPTQLLRHYTFDGGFSISTILYRLLLAKVESSGEVQQVFALRVPTTTQGASSQHAELLSFQEAWPMRTDPSVFLVLCDSSADEGGFGWSLRNLLAMLAVHASSQESTVRIIGLRGSHAKKIFSVLNSPNGSTETLSNQLRNLSDKDLLSGDESVVATFSITAAAVQPLVTQVCATLGVSSVQAIFEQFSSEEVRAGLSGSIGSLSSLAVVGWESNERGKPGPRVADLSQALDSSYLMAQAVDLNLRLMKWRLWPSLDTERLANTRCLLLGAGTLGCAVARALLGWGVRDITLVDSGRVSYSNPARQCLFEFEDCEMRSYKAIAAATRLRKIFPGVRSEGVVLSIPMAGHPLNMTHTHAPPGRDVGEDVPLDEESLISEDEAQFRRLDALVQSHDVCFALTDSREARWLPTVMCAAYGKLLINAALGFDTYLVMRHGQTTTGHNTEAHSMGLSAQVPEEERLGCYFCNDIVAATNSQKDRSLDQQCTVTRPGLSFIAAALAVELMVALAHPKNTEGEDKNNVEEQAERVGGPAANTAAPEIPHQIRGSVAGFTQFTPHAPAFSCCTACSPAIVRAFRDRGFEFVKEACLDSSVLEKTSGITRLMENVDVDDCVDSDDDF